ncbi:hypothetical protein CMT41_16000 [Colwellia sp. MT41]|uniref:PilW family protein n=1 Tax=Colwellia sp. MT41 TaxID=58049 RepID=UPI000717A687|nr:type II secretion system protein [Colwellia sp. MT41]ALO36061.1 hypothetical protein CMT41_16000 [Colwellia sp. MT41]
MMYFKNKFSIISRKASRGFTLIELVLVIIILGIMATGISGFISLSTQTYLNATNRDELIGNARFVIERLSRELRNAVPNSIRIQSWYGDRVQCIEFTPIVASTIYTDIPVLPELASKTLSVIPFNGADGNPYQCDSATGCTDKVTVYPLNKDDIYDDYTSKDGKIFRIDNIDTSVTPWKINILNITEITFDEDSPTQRLYITKEAISYCTMPVPPANTVTMVRFNDDINDGDQVIPFKQRYYMAGYLVDGHLVFNYQPATLKRNAVVQINLQFTKEDEKYVFSHEVHINNVP